MSPTKRSGNLSASHKAALAEGRTQGRAVRLYLEALEAHKPRRGRKRTPESIAKRIEHIDETLAEAEPLRRLQLIQERLDLQNELATSEAKVDLAALEADFVDAAKGYSERKGITYQAWRELGVAASTLKAAGITRKGV